MAVGKAGGMARAGDRGLPDGFSSRVEFQDLAGTEKGNEIAAARQCLDAAPTAGPVRHPNGFERLARRSFHLLNDSWASDIDDPAVGKSLSAKEEKPITR